MLTRIKICGVKEPQTASVAGEAGADAIGLVFVDRSVRQVDVIRARDIVAALPPFVEPVALFVDAPVAQIRKTANVLGLRTVQLHGRESPDDVAALRPLRVIKALGFDQIENGNAELKRFGALENLAGLLLDAPPVAGQLPGGSGRTFDWHALASKRMRHVLPQQVRRILAGGLSHANVAEAIGVVRPYAVDVSSGVESEPGVKEPKKIHTFCQAVRQADRELEV